MVKGRTAILALTIKIQQREQGTKKWTKENTTENKETNTTQKKEIESDVGDEGSDDVFCSIGGPCPECGMPYWEYHLNTVIVDHLSGNIFKIRDMVEGQVDSNGNPIVTKKTKK